MIRFDFSPTRYVKVSKSIVKNCGKFNCNSHSEVNSIVNYLKVLITIQFIFDLIFDKIFIF